jgi:hypothetical protein
MCQRQVSGPGPILSGVEPVVTWSRRHQEIARPTMDLVEPETVIAGPVRGEGALSTNHIDPQEDVLGMSRLVRRSLRA